jgi:hypothetical protein
MIPNKSYCLFPVIFTSEMANHPVYIVNKSNNLIYGNWATWKYFIYLITMLKTVTLLPDTIYSVVIFLCDMQWVVGYSLYFEIALYWNTIQAFLSDLVTIVYLWYIVLQAISVAERVADERCEPSPGSDGSLVGYQVRLDSARCSYACCTDWLWIVLRISETSFHQIPWLHSLMFCISFQEFNTIYFIDPIAFLGFWFWYQILSFLSFFVGLCFM